MLKRAPRLLFAFLLVSTPCLAGDRPPPDPAVKPLFVANCAQCHGEKGDGEGVTQLDRKARSFLEGGFSYGNTKDAILRSITHGIPGTPMPSFEKGLSLEQRTKLAEYVIALGPERLVVDPSESEMVVRDRPLVVRGKLPALVEGGPEIARGLAIGTPDGLTFEYRADDVQLVRVRAGAFVNRTDWGDRGGQPLEMLGKPVWTIGPALPLVRFHSGIDPSAASPWDQPGTCRLLATEIHDGVARVEYEARPTDPQARARVHVVERIARFECELGVGFVRRLSMKGSDASTFYCVSVMRSPNKSDSQGAFDLGDRFTWAVQSPLPGQTGELVALQVDRNPVGLEWEIGCALKGAEPVEVSLFHLPGVTMSTDSAANAQIVRSSFGRPR